MMLLKKTLWISLAVFLLAGNAVLAQDAPPEGEMMDDRCKPQEEALDACVETNNCQECEKQVGEGEPEIPPALSGEGGTPPPEGEGGIPSPEEIMAQLQGFLTASCDFFKKSSCALKECCPACATQLDEAYSCLSTNMGDDMNSGFEDLQGFVAGVGDALGNLTDALGDVGDALGDALGNVLGGEDEGTSQPTGAPVPTPEVDFTCDLKSVVCEEGGAATTSTEPEGEPAAPGTDPAPAPGEDPAPSPSDSSGSRGIGMILVSFLAGTSIMLQSF